MSQSPSEDDRLTPSVETSATNQAERWKDVLDRLGEGNRDTVSEERRAKVEEVLAAEIPRHSEALRRLGEN